MRVLRMPCHVINHVIHFQLALLVANYLQNYSLRIYHKYIQIKRNHELLHCQHVSCP